MNKDYTHWMDIVKLAGTTASPLHLRFNRGMLRNDGIAPTVKKQITSVVRNLLPSPFARASDEIQVKHHLESFRVIIHHNKGILSGVELEQPTGNGSYTKNRVTPELTMNRRPNESYRNVDSNGIEIHRSNINCTSN
jgi:hypothetical protein